MSTRNDRKNLSKDQLIDMIEALESRLAERVPGAWIEALNLRDGDTVVLKASGHISGAGVKRLTDSWRANFPNTKCVVLGDGLDISVSRPDDVDKAPERRDRMSPEEILTAFDRLIA